MITWATSLDAAPDRTHREFGEAVAPDPARRESGDREPTSEDLALRAGAGCAQAFGLLVDRHGGRVFRYLLNFTGRAQDAEDLTQETFVKAWRGLQRGAPPRAFAAWLFVIARRTALNHYRSLRPAIELSPELASTEADPAAVAMERDDRQFLWTAARRLPATYFEALWLRYVEGLSLREIAGVMRLGTIHTRVLLHRGRRRLLKQLASARERHP